MKTIRFNTGRKYTAEGQLIVATLHDDGVVTFMDHSRLVCGEFRLVQGDFDSDFVLTVYDSGEYSCGVRASQDGMMRDGVNRR